MSRRVFNTKERAERKRIADQKYSAKKNQTTARKAYMVEYNERNRERLRINARRFRYKTEFGLTMEDWDALFESQGKCCAICKATTPGSRNHWATDHDHLTNKVRGILCNPCSIMLGAAKDKVETLSAAIEYLGKGS